MNIKDFNNKTFNMNSSGLEEMDIKDPKEIGYMTRIFIQTNLPYKAVEGNVYRRTNGKWTLTVIDPYGFGLPYGVYPRLLINWAITESVTTKNKKIILGKSLASFLREIDIKKGGTVYKRLQDQIQRTFGCIYAFSFDDQEIKFSDRHTIPIATRQRYWWDQLDDLNETDKEPSFIILSDAFFAEVTDHSVPLSMGALKELKNSPMALDVYAWLTYRLAFLRKPVFISWEQLQNQFGPSYDHNRKFKQKFIEVLKKVKKVYSVANISLVNLGNNRNGLLLKPSSPSVPFKHKKE